MKKRDEEKGRWREEDEEKKMKKRRWRKEELKLNNVDLIISSIQIKWEQMDDKMG